jgi:DNA polymerase V
MSFAMLFDQQKISLDQLLNIRAPGTYLIKVEGDSMQGAGIFSGDILIVDKGMEPAAGRVVIALVNRDPLVKYLSFVDGMPVLTSANSKYPARYILENDEFEVWGVVTYSIRDHDRN